MNNNNKLYPISRHLREKSFDAFQGYERFTLVPVSPLPRPLVIEGTGICHEYLLDTYDAAMFGSRYLVFNFVQKLTTHEVMETPVSIHLNECVVEREEAGEEPDPDSYPLVYVREDQIEIFLSLNK